MTSSRLAGSLRPNANRVLPQAAWTDTARTGVINTIEITERYGGRLGLWGWILNAAFLQDVLPFVLTAIVVVPVIALLLWIGPTILSNLVAGLLSFQVFGTSILGVIAAIAIGVISFQTMVGGGRRQGSGMLSDAGGLGLRMIWNLLKLLIPIGFIHRNIRELFEARVHASRLDEQRGVPVRNGRLERQAQGSGAAGGPVRLTDQLRGPLPGGAAGGLQARQATGPRDEVDFRLVGEPNLPLFAGQLVTFYGHLDARGVFQVESGVDMRTGTQITRELRRRLQNL